MQKKIVPKEKAKRATGSTVNVFQIVVVSVVIVGASIVQQYYGNISEYVKNVLFPVVWQKDVVFRQKVAHSECDFRVLNASEVSTNSDLFTDDGVPVLVKGAALHWKATKDWGKQNLVTLYGNRSIQSGTESSIVYSGGTAAASMQFSKIIELLSSSDKKGDSFVFDASIIRSIPELVKDVEILDVFREWDNEASEKKQSMWHMLSMGPSQSGLPFHSHGKTWLAVIHGAKQWYVYPPGYSAPPQLEATHNPLLPVIDWFYKVLPVLQSLPKPPLLPTNKGDVITAEEQQRGFQPLQCIQEAGDVVFLPARWSHLTVNIGETIAIGGQSSLGAFARHTSASETLKKNPLHYESLKDVGLGHAHMAMERTRHIQQSIEQLLEYNLRGSKGLVEKSVILQLRSDAQLHAMLKATRDTWLILYVEKPPKDELETETTKLYTYAQILKAATELNSILDAKVNVAVFDPIPARTGDKIDKRMYSYRLHGGDSLLKDGETFNSRPEFLIDTEGLTYSGDVENLKTIEEFVEASMTSRDWQAGSVHSVTVLVQNMLEDAKLHISKAVELKPLHPETRGLLGELFGLCDDYDAMRASLAQSVQVFDDMNKEGISVESIASVYHKLATTFLSKELARDALPLLNKSLTILPEYLPSLVDVTVCGIINKDRPFAVDAVKHLMKVAPKHPLLPRFKQAINSIK